MFYCLLVGFYKSCNLKDTQNKWSIHTDNLSKQFYLGFQNILFLLITVHS